MSRLVYFSGYLFSVTSSLVFRICLVLIWNSMLLLTVHSFYIVILETLSRWPGLISLFCTFGGKNFLRVWAFRV